MSRVRFGLFAIGLALSAAVSTTGCGGQESAAPPVATPSITLSHDRVPAGSPLEITYKFVVANDAKFDEDFRVFAHIVDTDEEQMWTDDHNPPKPTSQWKPGETIEYTRTIFVPVFPYVGDASIVVGLHSTRDQHRLPLSGQDIGQLSYRVAQLQMLPQTDNLFTVFKDGWHSAEAAAHDAAVEWQWTKKVATLAFKNPKKDSVLYLDLDSPTKELHGPQKAQIIMGGETVAEVTVVPDERQLHKITLPGRLMGEAELAELQISVDNAFQPSVITGGASKDNRELGVRVFHAFVDPR